MNNILLTESSLGDRTESCALIVDRGYNGGPEGERGSSVSEDSVSIKCSSADVEVNLFLTADADTMSTNDTEKYPAVAQTLASYELVSSSESMSCNSKTYNADDNVLNSSNISVCKIITSHMSNNEPSRNGENNEVEAFHEDKEVSDFMNGNNSDASSNLDDVCNGSSIAVHALEDDQIGRVHPADTPVDDCKPQGGGHDEYLDSNRDHDFGTMCDTTNVGNLFEGVASSLRAVTTQYEDINVKTIDSNTQALDEQNHDIITTGYYDEHTWETNTKEKYENDANIQGLGAHYLENHDVVGNGQSECADVCIGNDGVEFLCQSFQSRLTCVLYLLLFVF